MLTIIRNSVHMLIIAMKKFEIRLTIVFLNNFFDNIGIIAVASMIKHTDEVPISSIGT